jgi:hypothetical protein
MRLTHLLLLACVLTGCARYEYDITEPPELVRHIGRGDPGQVVLKRDPLEYRLQTYDNRLVMRIHNPTPQPIELLGDKSFAVDPQSQSHPLKAQTIAPNSFIKLIFPPMPALYRDQPYLGYGIADYHPYYPYPTGFSGPGPYDPYYWPYYDPWVYDTPVYLSADGSDPTYWTWSGESAVRVRLVYRRGEETFNHEWVFQRRKMK